MSDSSQSNTFNRPVYHWLDHDLVVRKEARVKNTSGRTVNLVVEIRRPKNTCDFKVRIGRPSDTTVDKITKSLWFEDMPFLVDLINEAMVEAIDHYKEMKEDQIAASIRAETSALTEGIDKTSWAWKEQLVDFEF